MDEKIEEIKERYRMPNVNYSTIKVRADIAYLLSALDEREKRIKELENKVKNLKEFIKENYPSDHFDLVLKVKSLEEEMNIKEIEKELDRTFHRNCMADDDDETPLLREVSALERAVRDILHLLKGGQDGQRD